MLYSANDDPELQNWLNHQSTQGTGFLHSLADTAKLADIAQYAILRPALVVFRAQSPEPGSTVVGVIPIRAGAERVENSEEERVRRHRFSSIESIREDGFDGFVPISTLQSTDRPHVPDIPDVPNGRGVYYVLRPDSIPPPDFLEESTGGHFKNRNPTVPVTVLQEKWVRDAIVLYIGKAGPTEGRTLKTRLREYMRFGRGITVGKWGGRYIWQLQQSGNLLVCWKMIDDRDPEEVEKKLIREFEAAYGRMPFANLRH